MCNSFEKKVHHNRLAPTPSTKSPKNRPKQLVLKSTTPSPGRTIPVSDSESSSDNYNTAHSVQESSDEDPEPPPPRYPAWNRTPRVEEGAVSWDDVDEI